jgi:membrane associated rhomboid family serine protease
MSTVTPRRRPNVKALARRAETQREGVSLLLAILAVMWIVEIVNTADSNRLDGDGIYARSFSHLWGIVTAPFIHVSFQHLIANTIPFVFMGMIVALRGARRLALVTVIVIVVGGLLTWLIAPGSSGGRPVVTVGASGVVFGYATYLLARGFFDRSVLELLTGLVVGLIWGGALLSSLVPHYGISWQGHAGGALGGVFAAWLLRRERAPRAPRPGLTGTTAPAIPK